MATPPKQLTGIVGVPPLAIMQQLAEDKATIIDLDEPTEGIDLESVSFVLPRVYCGILRTVVANSLAHTPAVIYIDTGAGKCDCAVHTATILEDLLPKSTIIRTKNQDRTDFGIPLCRAKMDLVKKMSAITSSVQTVSSELVLSPCKPTAGFWGVPPRDFSLLSLFPDTTHVYGWARCMENKTPDNLAMECHFNPDIPTVFFAQTFCAKTALAKHLAGKHPRGLYLDCDITAGNSAKAKIQAFLELSGVEC